MTKEEFQEIGIAVFKRRLRAGCEGHPAFTNNLDEVLENNAVEIGISAGKAREFARILVDEIRAEEVAEIDGGQGLFVHVRTHKVSAP